MGLWRGGLAQTLKGIMLRVQSWDNYVHKIDTQESEPSNPLVLTYSTRHMVA